MTEPHGNSLPAAADESPPAGQELYLFVYHSCIISHLRILDAEISRLENGFSCLGLLNKVLGSLYGSTRSGLLDEISRTRAKRDMIYGEFEENLHRLEALNNGASVNEVGSPVSANSST